ncbi:Ankyrin repeat domain containing protein [Pandoravirus macleodensis]|uniref:Ankyrin repeat domain containing protein n=1 Tax=Pandoravirus macleodensis TaxID=2107707 RepID=A0A2U7UFE1_9VIRU|nr:Ankyrin repeat domain containing protein [Pandoravirus macleodensis]AVK77199.1 Ankyrin repeat domain containing protein [Pandoravirus macleodensis]
MDQQGQDEPAPIALAPPEILLCVLDHVSDRDFCAARKAHRIFRVASDRAVRRRRERHWLRTSPERACAAGRTDIVEFLWRRKRIPRTFDMWRAALTAGDPVLIKIAREQDPCEVKLDSVRKTAVQDDAHRLFFQLFDHPIEFLEPTIDRIMQYRATRIFMSLLGVAVRVRPRRWARLAVQWGYIDGLGILLDRYPWIPLGSIANAAMGQARDPTETLCLVREKDPLFPWPCILFKAVQSKSTRVVEFVCSRGHVQRPDLQAALDKAAAFDNVDIVELLCRQPAAQHLDLNSALTIAARSGCDGVVAFLCDQPTARPLDLQTAFVEAARFGQRRLVSLLGKRRPPLALQAAADVADEMYRGTAALYAIANVYRARTNPRSTLFCPAEPQLVLNWQARLERAVACGILMHVTIIVALAEDRVDLGAALELATSPRVADFLAKRMRIRVGSRAAIDTHAD